jgi:hypothetical protein
MRNVFADEEPQGEWRTKVGLVIPVMKYDPSRVFAVVVLSHPRTKRENLFQI